MLNSSLSKQICTCTCIGLLYILLTKGCLAYSLQIIQYLISLRWISYHQLILTECFCWFLPKSNPAGQPKFEIDNKCWSDVSAGWYFHLSRWGRWKRKNKDVHGNFARSLVTTATSSLNWIIVLKYQENMVSFLCAYQIQLSTWYTFSLSFIEV